MMLRGLRGSLGTLPLLGWLLLSWLVLPMGSEKKRQAATTLPIVPADSPLLDSLLHSHPGLLPVVSQAEQYELQIIYTQINRDAQQQPHFTQHSYHLNARQYFNPASMVKLPVAMLALEKLNQLNRPGLSRRTPMATGAAFRCQTPAPYVPSPDSDQVNTVGNYIKRMLLVSDNSAYNRLYEFLGQRPLNERLAKLGYPDARIVRRFAPCDTAANRHTNPVTFLRASNKEVIYHQSAAVNTQPFSFPLGPVRKGSGYYAGGRLLQRPYDFTTANYLPLQYIHDLLKTVLFPQSVPQAAQPDLTPQDYQFLRFYLRSTPHAASYSSYKSPKYFDAYKKYLYYGRNPSRQAIKNLHSYNIVGMSHGYLADVAYFVDTEQKVEFMLSAVLYVNKDGILNDGTYEYTNIGLPFLAALGQTIHRYEVKRLRPYYAIPAVYLQEETQR
ncbi:serine hydrolase [Hymenobacter lutimineralis]|uniref:beta-lactamase n=1 Tax=Hymenobacter lutimineralis TaxID=2606448 RepID=A0A5D6UXK8_9BACT|nr:MULTISPECIES: serine hydrolase [Hymenobacter]QIX62124.1 serine hydrolase [Hymenobacter sp. BT18]TYZ07094.1 serine hydrolase [Hymenobacter lutimineralis]